MFMLLDSPGGAVNAVRHDEEGMVAEFLAGMRSGLERVYEAYGRHLYSIARHVLRNEQDAQDCVHDVLLRLWKRTHPCRFERGSLRSYIAMCIRNDAIDRRRIAARRLTIEKRAARLDSTIYELEVNDSVDRARLRRALAELPEIQRKTLELIYFGHLTHVQVAKYFDVPLGAVKGRWTLGLRKLRGALQENDPPLVAIHRNSSRKGRLAEPDLT
jgi:RNA polymerase sigma-70 factor, ECF subfamily